MKRLIYDIEVSPDIGFFWQPGYNLTIDYKSIIKERAIICISYKWEGGKVNHLVWDKHQNDKYLIKEFAKILEEADEIVGHNCMEISTKVLKTDLNWVEVGSLKVGDELVGFDEDKTLNTSRRLNKSIVISNEIEEAECYEITLSNGEKVITTLDHKWLKLAPKGRDYRWCETKNLKIGHRVEKFFDVWEKDKSYESGWLSGFISGEGTLKQSGKSFSVDFCQRPTSTWEQAIGYVKKLGFECAKGVIKKGGLGRGDTLYTYIHGGKFKNLELLGKLQIDRLIKKIDWDSIGFLKGKSTTTLTIVDKKIIGKRKVAVLQTSTKTFFGAGLAMHNCDQFDTKWVRGRAIKFGIDLSFPIVTHDTLKIARNKFRFNSNRLDYLAKYLGVGGKIETGFDLWKDIVLHKDEVALKKMVRYCDNDVKILEAVWEKLKPYAVHKNAITMDRKKCPECGGVMEIAKHRILASGVLKVQLKCTECGKYNTIPASLLK